MKRTRRIVVTGAVVAGALGGAGLALTGSPVGAGVTNVTMSTPTVPSTPGGSAAGPQADALAQLSALAGQLTSAERGLQGQLSAATRDEERAKQRHDAAVTQAASRDAQARARAAQAAADQAAAAQAAQAAQVGTTAVVAGPGGTPMPPVHGTTRASGGGSGGDDGGRGDDGGDGGGDD